MLGQAAATCQRPARQSRLSTARRARLTAAARSLKSCRMWTSASSVLSCWVEVLELDAGIGGGEAPVDPAAGGIAGGLPGGDFAFQRRPVGQPPVQALLGQHAQLDLGHVQPAAMLGVAWSSSLSASRLASAGPN